MALHKLESLNEAQRLFDGAAHRKVVDAHVFDDAVGVDDKQPSTWGQDSVTGKEFLQFCFYTFVFLLMTSDGVFFPYLQVQSQKTLCIDTLYIK